MPIAVSGHKVEMRGHKVCRSCCDFCPDPNGCDGMPHKWLVDLHGTPYDGLYEVRLRNCGCDICPDGDCPGGRVGGSSWQYTGQGFKIRLAWQCLPAPDGQYWAVLVIFQHEGVERACWVRLPGVSDACSPEGVYDEAMCTDDPNSSLQCWTTWCSDFWAEVMSIGETPLAMAVQPSGKSGCTSCRGLA